MSPDAIAALISGIGVLMSLIGAAYIAGVKEGSLTERLSRIERDVAEIKGMFRLTLRKDDDNPRLCRYPGTDQTVYR